MNNITIHQNIGDDEFIMTVQVTQEELNKMEEIRKMNPSAWIGKEFDLLKETKNQLASRKEHRKTLIGILVLSIVLLSILIISIVVKNNNGKVSELTEGEMQEESIYQCFDEIKGQNRTLAETNDNNGMYKIWEKSVEYGYKGTFDDFVPFFNESEENRQKVWKFHVKNGYKGTFEEFLSFAGVSTKTAGEDQIDWEQVLADFIATKDAKPNLTTEEWFQKFPEFNNDEKLLQAAYDYDATVKSGKYSDPDVLHSKFPEFWPNKSTTNYYENIGKLYRDAKSRGMNWNEQQFREYLAGGVGNRHNMFLDLKDIGIKCDEQQFLEYIGYSSNGVNLEKARVLYDALSEDYDLGFYNEFINSLSSEKNRRTLFDSASDEYDLGTWEDFNKKLGFSTSSIPTETTSLATTKQSIDNLKKVYEKQVKELGLTDTYDQFKAFWNASDENKHRVYNKQVKEFGLTDSYDDFLAYVGSTNTPPTSSNVQATTSNLGNKAVQWPTYSIPNVCFITVPPTMELRDENSIAGRLFSAVNPMLYKLISDDCNVFSEHTRIVFQPAGMNSDITEDIDKATSTYARIIIEFGYNSELGQNDIITLTRKDLNDYSEIIESQYRREFDYAQQSLNLDGEFVWYPVQKKRINGKYCLVLNYDRSGLHGTVKVKKYVFYYNGKEIDVTLSYRISEKGKYENDFERVINSIKIQNK